MMSKFTTKLTTIVAALGLAGLCSCSDEAGIRWAGNGNTTITASIDGADALTRTCIDPKEYDNGVVGVLWTPGDKLGVFGNGSTKNALFTNSLTTNVDRASFTGTLAESETPQYAYYPYSKANAGKAVTELTGTVSAKQTFDLTTGKLTDDWKYGSLKTSTSDGHEFTMHHLFAMAKVVIDATGSPVEGETLESIEVTLPEGRQLCGDFTFSAVDGSYTLGTCTNSVKMVWSDKPALTSDKSYTGYLTLIPEGVKENDKITIKILTSQHQATFEVPCLVDFQKGTIYSMPMTLTLLAEKMKTAYDKEPTYEKVGTTDPEPTVTTGTFTACAFNVDGLPQKISGININKDGPGSSGTTTMAGIANNLGWDIIAASEDFEYHSQLATGLSNYNAGSYRGTITSDQLLTRANTDGLCFFWKKGLTVTSEGNSPGSNGWEKMVQYNDEEGGLAKGANTCIKKGFRHYEVVVDATNNVIVDVYITHMNTYSGSGNTENNAFVKAVLGQLRQLRDYVLEKAKANKRPAIIMGDTNMRYTRHDIKTNFLDVVAAYDSNAGYTVSDPWVEFYRGGDYPSWNSKSLMIRAHANSDGLSSDIICADDQRGEVVDKIWYINVPGAEVQLKATAHKNDVDNFKKQTTSVSFSGATLEDANGNVTENQSITYNKVVGYSDHFPVVTTFQWTKTVK